MSSSLLSRVRHVLVDCDGVLTDGTLPYAAQAEERKSFHSRDGAMIRYAAGLGLRTGICSGRPGAAVQRRADELDLTPVLLGVDDKVAAIDAWLTGQTDLSWSGLCFVGDDLPDAGPLMRAGVGVAVADATPWLRRRADVVTRAPGGAGAVAEILARILRAQGRWRDPLDLAREAHG
ncbi:MAG: KdsC family phosphatase [Planctomycetota bacterium]